MRTGANPLSADQAQRLDYLKLVRGLRHAHERGADFFGVSGRADRDDGPEDLFNSVHDFSCWC